MSFARSLVRALVLAAVTACSDTGEGTEKFTTWGESFVENGIPPGDGSASFVDGWSVKYSRFIVNFHDITVADAAGTVVGRQTTPAFVDNTKPGVKELIAFRGLEARSYTQVSYAIKPAVAGETVIGGSDAADLQMMIANGYSIYVAGTATKANTTKTFKWGFKTQTSYRDCHSAEENGITTEGVVVTNNQTDESQLTTHGDHLFYDSLQAGDNAKPTKLRFDEKAAADANGDGEITLRELCQARIDPSLYNTSGLPGATIGDFVISLARTIGHFRHEGECTIRRLDPPAAGVVNPCDDYR